MTKKLWKKEIGSRLFDYKKYIYFLFLLTAVGATVSAIPPILIGNITDFILNNNNYTLLIILSFVLFFVVIFQELTISARQYYATYITLKFCNRVRYDLYKKILYKDKEQFNDRKRGDLLQLFSDDIDAIQKFGLETIPKFFHEIILCLIAIFVICNIYFPIAILGTAIYVSYLIPLKFFGKIQYNVANDLRDFKVHLKHKLLEKLESVRLIKSLAYEEKEKSNMKILQEKWLYLTRKRYVTDNMFRNFPRILDALAPAVVFIVGGYQVFINNISIGELVTITGFLPAINAPIRSFSNTFLSIKDIENKLERIGINLITYSEINSYTETENIKINGRIELKNVNYTVNSKEVLKDISFIINPGEHISIVGPSGSGKSTILKLINQLVFASSGDIFINNLKINKSSQIKTNNIIYVGQNTFLFNDTLYNNLTYIEKNDKLMFELLEKLNLQKLINKLPNGLNEIVGDNGYNFSGGQRQRIGIVRNFLSLSKAKIMLLDEVTSALDKKNEEAFYNLLGEKSENITVINVVHKIESIHTERILVLNNGLLEADGSHNELLRTSPTYVKLWNKSKKGYLNYGTK